MMLGCKNKATCQVHRQTTIKQIKSITDLRTPDGVGASSGASRFSSGGSMTALGFWLKGVESSSKSLESAAIISRGSLRLTEEGSAVEETGA